MEARTEPVVALVGAGAVATSLAHALRMQGVSIAAVLSRSSASAEALAHAVGAAAWGSLGRVPLPPVTDVFIAVPDSALSAVVASLAEGSWEGVWVAHLSGALSHQELDPLRRRGARICSFHPMQSFIRGRLSTFAGICIGVEGEPEAVARATWWAEQIGARPILVPGSAKGAYHLAGTMASNYLVALLGISSEILASLGLSSAQALELLRPLVRGVLENAEALRCPEQALSGPIRRGDAVTLRRHGRVLAERFPHLIPVYVALGVETLRLAVRQGWLNPERAQAVLAELEAMLRLDPSVEAPL
ncbi:MAG: DUF2520 domain-containing protein [Bacteroidetes bacterium]|nr:DUF2520 domain-containing protein [Rhodothermia bacterium]MCS7154777.1 DUF2520 domain-containing protein [Bacteroidota bacterium]MCX7907066.1 DUF2520 domain-containing protein [Bacteroidota bacterium]MDW8137570.1 DUF2520 domain-containing protein [Bacteroidota bacterium]MDW8285476.1 DUF2520 domain-containing protein [Bacteroidota bacterium]